MTGKPPTNERKTPWPGLLGGVILVAVIGQLLLLPIGDGLARWSYDLPFLCTQRSVPDNVVMVYLDAKIKAGLGQPTDQPLDRRFYTQLLERLTTDGAKLVFFDILFDNPHSDASVDSEFASAIRQHGRVVLVGYSVKQFQGNIVTTTPLPPIPVLTAVAAGWGLAEISPDAADQTVRILNSGSEDLPSASWAAASILNAPVTKHPESRLAKRWLNYYCEPTLIKSVNLDQALQTDGLPSGYFRDKIVIVGVRPSGGGIAGSEREEFPTPYSRFDGPTASGPSIHALSLLNLQRGDWLTRFSFAEESAVALLWGVLVSAMLFRLRPLAATLAAPAVFCAFALTAMFVQARWHVWFAWMVPAGAQTSVALIWSVGFQYLVESRRRRKLRHAFASYLSPYMADQIANSQFDLSLGGKEVEATIMFTDLEGFTQMSETLAPAEVSHILTSYFNETTRAILEEDGTIIKYMGDAVLAVWGAPMPESKHAERAVRAGWGMIQAGRKEIAGRTLRTRIGINSGMVLAGNLGSIFRFDYAAIGNTTNTAARLESLNKYFATNLLIGGATREQLGDQIRSRCLGLFLLSGKTQPVSVHEVLGVDSIAGEDIAWVTAFDTAVRHFVEQKLDEAEACFREVIKLRGGQDGPSEFYLKEIAAARSSPPASDHSWDGVITIASK
jgi:adenylate cyclase